MGVVHVHSHFNYIVNTSVLHGKTSECKLDIQKMLVFTIRTKANTPSVTSQNPKWLLTDQIHGLNHTRATTRHLKYNIWYVTWKEPKDAKNIKEEDTNCLSGVNGRKVDQHLHHFDSGVTPTRRAVWRFSLEHLTGINAFKSYKWIKEFKFGLPNCVFTEGRK